MSPPAPPPPGRRRSGSAAYAVAAAVGLAVPVALTWPLVLNLHDAVPGTPFTGNTVYQIEVQTGMLWGERPATLLVDDVGFPVGGDAVLVGWPLAVLVAPLRPWLEAPALFSLALLLTPALSALAATWAVSRFARLEGAAAGLLGAGFALSPLVLGAIAAGALEKLAVGMFPAFFAAVLVAITEGGWRLLLPALVAGVSGFVDPSMAVYLPFVGAAAGGVGLARSGFARGAVTSTLLAALLAVAAMVPAAVHYGAAHAETGEHGRPHAFAPLVDPGTIHQEWPNQLAPVATFDTIWRPLAPRELEPRLYYVTYLGWPVGLLFLLALLRGAPGRGWPALLALVGVTLAFGPKLSAGTEWVEWRGGHVTLPAAWLGWLVPQLRISGAWYRALGPGWLGIVLVLAGGVARLPERWRTVGAAVVAVAITGGGLFATAFLWPVPVAPIVGVDTLRAWARDPVPGATFDLPLEGAHLESGGPAAATPVMASTLTHRPTTALPRADASWLLPAAEQGRTLSQALAAGDTAGAEAVFGRAGFRYVTWRDEAPPEDALLDALTTLLGPAEQDGGLHWWTIPPPAEPSPALLRMGVGGSLPRPASPPP